MQSMTDKGLVDCWVRERDADAFNAITKRYAGLVFAAAMRILRNASDAEDVTQACFERLAITAHPPQGALAPWLHRVATNRALDLLRTTRNRTRREQDFAERHESTAPVVWDDVYAYVDEAVNELPEDLRVVLVERYYANRSIEDIANTLGVTRRTVYHRRARGLSIVRKTLRKRGISVATSALAALFTTHLAEAATLPAATSIALGQLAIAGLAANGAPSAITSIATAGGLFAMKKVVGTVIAVIALVAGLALWRTMYPPLPKAEPAPDSYTARIEPASSEVNEENEGADSSAEDNSPTTAVSTPDEEGGAPSGDIAGRFYNLVTGEGIPGLRPNIFEVVDGRITKHELSAGGEESGKDGRYRILDLPPGRYSLEAPDVARFPGVSESIKEKRVVTVVADAVAGNVDFALVPGAKVSGFVRDVTGEPVPGASVSARCVWTWNSAETTSSSKGEYELYLPWGGETFQILGWKDAMYSPLIKGALDNDVRIDLELSAPTASISGVLFDEYRSPISDATMGIRRDSSHPLEFVSRVKTDEDGRFRIDGLAAGKIALYFTLPPAEWQPMPERLLLETTLSPGETQEGLEFFLEGTLNISGQLLSADGEGVARSMMSAFLADDPDLPRAAFARSKEDGSFTFTGLSAGNYRISAADTGQTGRYMRTTLFEPSYPAGATNVRLVFDPLKTLQGRVVQAGTNNAVTQYRVYVRHGDSGAGLPRGFYDECAKFVSDPDGRFEVKTTSDYVTVGVIAAGYEPTHRDVQMPGNGRTGEVVIALNPSRYVEGNVVNTRGQAVAGARIYRGETRSIGGETQPLARSDVLGRFSIDTLPDSTQTLIATHPAYPSQEKRVASHVTFVLEAGGALEGRVTAQGAPVTEAYVGLLQNGKRVPAKQASVDAAGQYMISNLASGAYVVEVFTNHQKTKAERSTLIQADETTVEDFDLALGDATVQGHILGVEDLERVYVSLAVSADTGKQDYRGEIGREGGFQFNGLPAGSAQLTANVYENNQQSQKRVYPLEIHEGDSITQDIVFSAGGSVTGVLAGLTPDRAGTVVALNGAVDLSFLVTVDDVAAFLPQGHAMSVGQVECNQAGEYRVDGLAPGTYTLVAVTTSTQDQNDIAQWEWSAAVIAIEEEGQILAQDFAFP